MGTVSGTLYAIAAASGQVLWTYQPGSGMTSSLAVGGGMVYLKDNNGTVQAVSAASGKKVWARSSVPTGLWGLTLAARRLYYSTALAVQALDAKTGTPAWAFSPSGSAPGAAQFLSTPAVADGLAFVGCNDDGLYAIQA